MPNSPGESVDSHCPFCGESVHRIRRRFSDRVLSIVFPVRRYRCDNPMCAWEGVLRVRRRRRSRVSP